MNNFKIRRMAERAANTVIGIRGGVLNESLMVSRELTPRGEKTSLGVVGEAAQQVLGECEKGLLVFTVNNRREGFGLISLKVKKREQSGDLAVEEYYLGAGRDRGSIRTTGIDSSPRVVEVLKGLERWINATNPPKRPITQGWLRHRPGDLLRVDQLIAEYPRQRIN